MMNPTRHLVPFLAALPSLALPALADDAPAGRPNILWISNEDHGPHMGCYGDKYASTPNGDALAARGMLYRHAWSCAPVCAPARTTIISGLYPPCTGSEHMRSLVAFPAGLKMFPEYLREAGWYCTNNSKEDYNLAKPGKVWDESSKNAHWRGRAKGQPFFAVFNSLKSHESQIRTRPHKAVHDPAGVRVPAYHPDTPEVRRDWAQYYDQVSAADADAGVLLKQLEEDGLADDTIVFYWADHGSGMPRSKRWPGNSGLQVPVIVHFPAKFRHLAPPDYKPGGASDRLISFVDFAPTMLSLAGHKPPEWMQGRAFAGPHIAPAPEFLHGFRGRMDERLDLVRSITDGRYVYIRNYLPHLPAGRYLDYMFQTPTTRVWHQLFDQGKLNEAQSAFFRPKAFEELYDLQIDPDEVKNLAASAEHKTVLERLRTAHREHERRIRDLGFVPEGERLARAAGTSLYDWGRDDARYPFDKVFAAAEAASNPDTETAALVRMLGDGESAVRYWGAVGLAIRGGEAVKTNREALAAALGDSSPYVRIAAAETLARHGGEADVKAALNVLIESSSWERHGVFAAVSALDALSVLGKAAAPVGDRLASLPTKGPAPDARYKPYVPRLLTDLAAQLGVPGPKIDGAEATPKKAGKRKAEN